MAVLLFNTVLRRPVLSGAVLLLLLLICIFAGSQRLVLDVSMEGIMGQNSAPVSDYRQFLQSFAHDQNFLLLVESEHLFTEDGLHALAVLEQEISGLHPAIVSVRSALDIPVTDHSQSPAQIGSALQLAATGRHFDHESWFTSVPALARLFNGQRTRTLLTVSVLPDSGDVQPGGAVLASVYESLALWLRQQSGQEIRVQMAGQGAFLGLVHILMVSDLYLLPVISLVASLLLLVLLFRTATAMVLPILVVTPPVVVVASIAFVLGLPLRITSILMPPALIVIGVAMTVHLLTAFYQTYRPGTDKSQIMLDVVREKFRPLLLATLTTAGAFLAFATVPLASVRELGLMAGIGALLLLPALICGAALFISLPFVRPVARAERTGVVDVMVRSMARGGIYLSERAPKLTLAVTLIAVAVATLFAASVRISYQPADWLPQEHELFHVTRRIAEDFPASVQLELALDSGQTQGIFAGDFIHQVETLTAQLRTLPDHLVGRLIIDSPVHDSDFSVHDLVLMRMTSPQALERYFSPDMSIARIGIRLPMLEGGAYQPLIDAVAAMTAHSGPYPVLMTGQPVIMAATHDAMVESAVMGYLVSGLALLLMMIVLSGRLSDGVLLMLPNLLPVIVVMALMPVLGWSLDLLSLLVISVSMGLVVDDTIHLAAAFRRGRNNGLTSTEAVRQALYGAGRAMTITTVILVIGWQMLLFSQFDAVTRFGYLTSVVMILGLLADFLIAPSLLVVAEQLRGVQSNVARNSGTATDAGP